MADHGAPRIPLQVSRQCIVASLQVDLTADALSQFREDLLEFHRRSNARAVLLDLSGIEVMDADEFHGLKQILLMTAMMGARPVIAGLQSGVVSALVDLGVDTQGLETVLNLDDAFALVEPAQEDDTPVEGDAPDMEQRPDDQALADDAAEKDQDQDRE